MSYIRIIESSIKATNNSTLHQRNTSGNVLSMKVRKNFTVISLFSRRENLKSSSSVVVKEDR